MKRPGGGRRPGQVCRATTAICWWRLGVRAATRCGDPRFDASYRGRRGTRRRRRNLLVRRQARSRPPRLPGRGPPCLGGHLPLHLWIDLRIEPNDDGTLRLFTTGMKALDKMEIEIPQCRHEACGTLRLRLLDCRLPAVSKCRDSRRPHRRPQRRRKNSRRACAIHVGQQDDRAAARLFKRAYSSSPGSGDGPGD